MLSSHPKSGSLASTAALLTLLASPAMAVDAVESARIRDLEQKLEHSMKMIESLANKVQQLEQVKATPVAVAAVAAPQDARIDDLQKQVSDITSARSRASDVGLPIHGFTDVGAGRSSQDNAVYGKGAKGFAVGNFDLYLTPQFGDRVKALIELNFEVGAPDSLATPQASGVGVDLERLQLGYTFADSATGWLGRFHTPYGYWNNAFHHGAQIQTSIMRPRFLDFEDKGGILPAHTTGAWLAGTIPLVGSKLGYDVYAGNAPQIIGKTMDMKMAGDFSHSTSTGFNVSFIPGDMPDLKVGLHGLRGQVHDDATTRNVTRLNMFGGYGMYNNDLLEILTEYYHFRNEDISGSTGKHGSSAWFAQAGYNLSGFTPYIRQEKATLDQTDNYFAAQTSGRSYQRSVLGIRYDLNTKAAVKFEINHTKQNDLGVGISADGYNESRVQYAVRF